MTYDSWKATDSDPCDPCGKPEDELQIIYEQLFLLRVSHDRLLAAATATVRDAHELCLLEFKWLPALEDAIAKAKTV